MNLDPAFVLSVLAGLSEGESDDEHFSEDSSDDEDEVDGGAYPLTTQEGMARRFKTMRARFVQPGGIFGEQIFAGNVSVSSFSINDTKPNSDMKPLQSLKPMTAKELELGTTHRGRYICGWVAVDDAFFGIASTSLILEDVAGYLVEIAAYGLVDPDLPPHERQCILSHQFPKGQPIIVIEPYYKARMDGSEGIRIDQPEEILPWREVPTDLITWKELGNEFFSVRSTKDEGRGALACYQRALKAEQSEVHTLVLLLNNLTTCRFKMGDYGTAIQLSGAAVHLDPTYVKGWIRLASAATESKLESLTARVIAHARRILPRMSFEELQMLNSTLKTDASSNRTFKLPQLHSFAEWCMKLETPGSVLAEGGLAGEMKTADAWRQEGSAYFAKGDFGAAEKCYRKGLELSRPSNRNVSIVLNNVAAVHLMPCGETDGGSRGSENPEDEIPRAEAALLNCTVAGLIDPLNSKAWLRRARCLQKLGFTPEICIHDLQAVRTSVVSMSVFSKDTMERLNEFQRNMDTDIHQRFQQSAGSKTDQVSIEPCDSYADAFSREPSSEENRFAGVQVGEEESIDECITHMDRFVRNMRSAYARANSEIPREIRMFLQDPPPQIHTEFPELRGWPDGIDPVFAGKVLYRTYLHATLKPWVGVYQIRNGSFFEGLTFVDRVKRWHGMGALEILRARGGVKYGEIVDGREALSNYVPKYESRARSSFANSPSRTEFYFFGTTHVAIGFNDFSSLLAAALTDESNSNSPLKWVGFEMSEFVIAKCKVVAHMLGCSSVPISSVMEVWLSSTWSETTLKDFRESVNAVLESLRERNENRKVMSYLSHWASVEPISAAEARSVFFSDLEKHNKMAFTALCSFRREIDRLDLTQYMLSGEIRASSNVMNLMEKEEPGAASMRTDTVETGQSEPTKKRNRKKSKKKKNKKKNVAKGTVPTPSLAHLVGNVTMWNMPQGAPPLRDDTALNTVAFTNLLEDYLERENKEKHSSDRLSVVDLFVIHIMKNLNRLRGLMLAHKLTIEVHHGVVKAVRGEAADDPVNKKMLARIALMRPRTMSWSNLVDYFLPEDFHDIVRRCSMYGRCMHCGYSMNWPTQVVGVSIMDFDPGNSKRLIDDVLGAAFGFENELMPIPLLTIFKGLGLDKLLFLPFREHPLNGTAFVLACLFDDEWIDHFMKKGELTNRALQRLGGSSTPFNCGLQKGSTDLLVPNPLYRSSLTLFMSWCYDPNANLVRTNSPSEPSNAVGAALLAQLMQHLGL